MKKKKHTITLDGFSMEKGRIPFDLLFQIADGLTSVAGGTLRLFMQGHSSTKRGKQPEWLEKSLAFDLVGLQSGSTILEVEAPVLEDTLLGNTQIPIPYGVMDVEELKKETAIGLGMRALTQAFSGKDDVSLLDKQLLQEMQRLKRVFNSPQSSFTVSGYRHKPVKLKQETFNKIKKLESATAPSLTARITGKFDLMRHSTSLMEIITEGKTIRAFLTGDLKIEDVKAFFGEEVTIDGTAHFNPRKQVSSFEVKKVRQASASDEYFKRIPEPVSEQLQLLEEARTKGYTGTKLDKVMGQWPGDESIDELLSLLD